MPLQTLYPIGFWHNRILFRDSFDRPDGTIGGLWIGATWTINAGKVINTPGLGSELLTNGDFSAWTSNNPNGWTVTESPPTTSEVSQVSGGQSHGASGTGLANVYGSYILRQSILTLGRWYRMSVLIDTITTGKLECKLGQTSSDRILFNSTGTRVGTGRSQGASLPDRFILWQPTSPVISADITIDNVSCKQLTLSSLFATVSGVARADLQLQVDLTLPSNDQVAAGLVLNLDETTNPQNFVIVYFQQRNNESEDCIKIEKCIAGTYTTVSTITATYVAGATLKVEKVGRKYYIYYNGKIITDAQIITDTSIIANTKFGLFSTDATVQFNNFIASEATGVGSSLAIDTPQPFQVHQRSGTTADIPIAGTIKVNGTFTIQASFNGGAYTNIASNVSGPGPFAGTLASQNQGQGTLSVRILETGATISLPYVGIGDVFIIAGQSNATGRGTNSQSYSGVIKATMLGNDYKWKNFTDPTDRTTDGQVDLVSRDVTPEPAGSIWPLIATYYLASTGLPCAFIPCAMGGTSIANWQPGASHTDRSTLYGSMNYRASLTGCKVVLWWQGEADALNSMSQSSYNTYLVALANAINADRGVKLMPCKLQNSSAITDANEANINNAIVANWGVGNILTGPDLSDLASDDGFHLQTDQKLATVAARWWNAIKTAFSFP